VSQALMVFA